MKRKRIAGIIITITMIIGMCGCGAANTEQEPAVNDSLITGSVEVPDDTGNTVVSGEQGNEASGETAEGSGSSEGTVQESASADSGSGEQEASHDDFVSRIELLHPVIYENYKSLSSDTYQQILNVKWCEVELSEEESSKYPELAESLRQENLKQVETATASYEQNVEDARAFQEMSDSVYYGGFADEIVASVARADSNVFSVKHYYYGYYGGAHGFYSYTGQNYDTATGKLLALSDVITDTARLGEILEEKLFQYYEDNLDREYFDSSFQGYLSGEYSYDWLMDYTGVTFYFNPYSIAPYAAGMMSVTIGYDEYPGLVDPKYTKLPSSYVFEMDDYDSAFCDINGDGSAEEIRIYGDMNEYGEYEKRTININGKETVFEVFYFSADIYLVKNEDDRYFLYSFNGTYNDYVFLQVYEITGGTPRMVLEARNLRIASLLGDYSYNEDEYMSTGKVKKYSFTDVTGVVLESRIDALSTTNGNDRYHINGDGLPEGENGYYTLESEIFFTTLVDLEMTEVDEKGNPGAAITVSKGSRVRYYRTDGETWSDFLLEDGRIGRVQIGTEWPQSVNGMELESVFDGTFFAG